MTEKSTVPNASLVDIGNITGQQVFKITREQTRIGRSPSNEFVILKGTVSVSHALLFYKNQDFFLEDLQSTNKTRLNGKVIPPNIPVSLANGDEIVFDVFKFIFLVEKPREEEYDEPHVAESVVHESRPDSQEDDLKESETPDISPITTIEKYESLKLLGKGGFGSVWKARDPHGTVVAVKILNPDVLENERAVRKFFHEAIVLSQLQHPHITRFIDFFPEKGNYAIVMDFVEGSDLKSMLQERYGPLPFSQACKIAEQTLDAFQYAHEKQILHRDIKPENIIFDINQNVKVMDFGLAKMASAATQNTSVYMISTQYTPPERFDRNCEVSTQSDIYSLGLVFYEIFTGRRPFPATKPSDIIFAHINTLPDSPEEIANMPRHMSDAILKALEKEPKERFRDFAEFKEALLEQNYETTENRHTKKPLSREAAVEKETPSRSEIKSVEQEAEGLLCISPEHYQAGITILKFFIKTLMKFQLQPPKSRITQHGTILKLTIDLPNGKQVIDEKDMKKITQQLSSGT